MIRAVNRRSNMLRCAVLAFYAASVVAVALVLRRGAVERTEELLDYAEEDARDSLELSIDQILDHIGSSVVAELGTARPVPFERMVEMARLRDIDELNIVRADGVILGASDPDVKAGVSNMNKSERSGAFMCLARGTRMYSQPFRHGAHNPTRIRKFLGVAFPDGSGYVQLGYDEKRFADDFDVRFAPSFDDWKVGSSGFYVCAKMADERIVADAPDVKMRGRTLAEAGLASVGLPPAGQTFSRRVFGRRCHCRELVYGQHRIIAVVPWSEYHGQAFVAAVATGGVLLVVFAACVVLFTLMRRDQRHVAELRAAEDARRAADMAMARSIQMSSLPLTFPPFANCLEIALYASMQPAREIGGDFYDYFFVSQDRLAVLIADVSGKGVPAAMFMMKAKATIRSCVVARGDLADAMADANARLCQGNEAGMFVTAWLGVLNVRTGDLEYVNAGHNPPYVRRATGGLETIADVSGLFLGGMEEISYRKSALRLEKGDLLFLYTDGITEANDVGGAMFGEGRLEELLRCGLPDPERCCRAVCEAADGFAAGAAQFDDMTTLALYFRGAPERAELTLKVGEGCLAAVAAFVEGRLEADGVSGAQRAHMMVAVDEISNNIVSYSGSPELTVQYEFASHPATARVTFVDSGTPWNPLTHADPDITLSAAERSIGGLGIFMVKKLMDDVSYEFRDGQNRLTFRKTWPDADTEERK